MARLIEMMIHLNPVEPSKLNPFTLANDMNVFSWHALLLKMQKSKKTIVVTGAGISVEAGIPVRVFTLNLRILGLKKDFTI